MTFWIIFLIVLSIVHICVVTFLTRMVVREVREAGELSRGRVVYESEELGTLTAYKDDAILELLDGTVHVIPRLEEVVVE